MFKGNETKSYDIAANKAELVTKGLPFAPRSKGAIKPCSAKWASSLSRTTPAWLRTTPERTSTSEATHRLSTNNFRA